MCAAREVSPLLSLFLSRRLNFCFCPVSLSVFLRVEGTLLDCFVTAFRRGISIEIQWDATRVSRRFHRASRSDASHSRHSAGVIPLSGPFDLETTPCPLPSPRGLSRSRTASLARFLSGKPSADSRSSTIHYYARAMTSERPTRNNSRERFLARRPVGTSRSV